MTVPEATPGHEAAVLQRDLDRAGIRPLAWVVNQSLSPVALSVSVLRQRRAHEAKYLREVMSLGAKAVLVPWMPSFAADTPPPGPRAVAPAIEGLS